MTREKSRQSKGGEARRDKLSPAERKAIAKKAARARWKDGALPKAVHGDSDRPLRIGDIEIPCYVLEDGTRVITQRGLQRALGMAESGGAQRMLTFVGRLDEKVVEEKDLSVRIGTPLRFRLPKGVSAIGYEATVLADMCDAVLAARKLGLLQKQQLHIADQCEILMRGFARVGIVALVDEATGYQHVRARHALSEILDQYVTDELRKWSKVFPDEFYRELFRLKGLQYIPFPKKKPRYVGHWTNNIVYSRLAPGVLGELRAKTPRTSNGHRKNKFHQWLTSDVGDPRLREHLSAVIALMKVSQTWEQFEQMLRTAFPKQPQTCDMEEGSDSLNT